MIEVKEDGSSLKYRLERSAQSRSDGKPGEGASTEEASQESAGSGVAPGPPSSVLFVSDNGIARVAGIWSLGIDQHTVEVKGVVHCNFPRWRLKMYRCLEIIGEGCCLVLPGPREPVA